VEATTSDVKRSGPVLGQLAAVIMTIGAIVLFGSLFLTWSHQFSPSLLARYGQSPVLRGVPRDPNAWQVYSVVDVILAILAGAIALTARFGDRRGRLVLAAFVLVALAFVVHALKVPPTNGANIFDPFAHPPGYVPNSPRSGPGEVLAAAALALTICGISASFTTD
jgi:hypothetical protein